MIDLLLLGVIVVSALFGLMRGLLATVFGVLGWLLAGWAAFRFGHDASVMLSGGATPTLGQYAAGHAIAFFGVLLVVSAIGLLLRGVVDSTVLLKGPDRLFGFGLGIVRGVLVAAFSGGVVAAPAGRLAARAAAGTAGRAGAPAAGLGQGGAGRR